MNTKQLQAITRTMSRTTDEYKDASRELKKRGVPVLTHCMCPRGKKYIPQNKYKNLYGLTGKEIASKYNKSVGFVYRLHRQGCLESFIKNPTSKSYTKYVKKYGIQAQEIADIIGVSTSTVFRLDEKGCLVDKIREKTWRLLRILHKLPSRNLYLKGI